MIDMFTTYAHQKALVVSVATVLVVTGVCFTKITADELTVIDTDIIELDYDTPVDPELQMKLAEIDIAIRDELEIESEQTAVGLCDLKSGKLAMLRPDTMYYAASVPKIAILLAYFETEVGPEGGIDDQTADELGQMIKRSSNALAAKYSQIVTLGRIADVLQSDKYGLYDPLRGGGLWMGKHYAKDSERRGDPLTNNSHAATVRQLLRYYLMLERGELVSPAASAQMRRIFEGPQLDHLQHKFLKTLADRDVQVIRKSGTWRDFHADTAVITGEDRHYILVALTHHDNGAEYLTVLAGHVDDLAQGGF